MLLLFEDHLVVKTFLWSGVEELTRKSVRLMMDRTSLKADLRNALANPYIILLALVVLVSASSLKNSFISGDDTNLIVNNYKVNLSLEKVPLMFSKPLGFLSNDHENSYARLNAPYYRPMLQVLYALNYAIWGVNPVGFHLTNIMFHLFNAIIVYKIGLLLFNQDKKISIVAACLFAVHPVNNELLHRVAMNENMYGFFVITSLYFFLNKKTFLSYFAFALALLSKESAIVLPLAICLFSVRNNGLKKGIVSMAPFILIVAVYFVLRLMIINFNLMTGIALAIPIFPRILTMAAAFFDYLRLLIIPYPLSPYYPARIYMSLLQPKVIAAIAVVVAFCFLLLRLRKDRAMFFLLLSLSIFLMPVILKVDTFPLDTEVAYIAERFLYVPAMFFSLFVAALAFKGAPDSAKKYVIAGLTMIIVVFTSITASSSGVWENYTTFCDKLSKDAPDSAIAHSHKGTIFIQEGKLNEAINEYTAAFNPNPSFIKDLSTYYDYYKDNRSVGKILFSNGKRPSSTVKLYRYQPVFADLHFALGRIYLMQGDIDRAIRKFRVASVLQPDNTDAHLYLANAYMRKKDFDSARKEFRYVLKKEADGQ
jgi:tetratricopeptide (TPR) repeat protein